jgi:thioredoxin-related protein
MKKIIVPMLAFLPVWLTAQNEQGIHFRNDLTWSQVKDLARLQNKLIFIDVYGTWCVPCRQMDEEVYIKDTIGKAVSNRFIAIRLQCDTSTRDNAEVKNWYPVSHELIVKYSVTSYPTFLFITPEGNLLYRDRGYKDVNGFITLVKEASNPQNEQYAQKVVDYKRGKKNYTSLPEVSLYTVRVIQDKMIADTMAIDCLENYLDTLSESDFFKNDIPEFLTQFDSKIHLNSRVFEMCYTEPKLMDSIVKMEGWANSIVDFCITKDILDKNFLKNGHLVLTHPRWAMLSSRIKNIYVRADADKIILNYKLYYYRSQNNWKEWADAKDEHLAKYPPKPGTLDFYAQLNYFGAWDAFLRCNDTAVLNSALNWIQLAISSNAEGDIKRRDQYLDTKASILYKLGKLKGAIYTESQAASQCDTITAHYKIDKRSDKNGYLKILSKMQKGLPIYTESGAIWDVITLQLIQNKAA